MSLQRVVTVSLAELKVELVGWTSGDFLRGLSLVCRGTLRWARSEREACVVEASRKLRWFAIAVFVTSFAVLGTLWAVSIFLMWLVTTLVTLLGPTWLLERLQLMFEAMAFKYVIFSIAFVVPQCTMLFVRYWANSDQDRIFVAALRMHQPLTATTAKRLKAIAFALEELPAESTWRWLRRYSTDGLKGWLMAIVVLALSSLRGVGPLIYQVAIGLRRRSAIGFILALAVLALPLFPNGRVLSAYGLQLALMARSISKELLYTFLGRSSKAQRHAMRGTRHAYLMGFGLGAGVLLSIPIVGPMLWFDLVYMAGQFFSDVVVAEERDELFSLEPALALFREEEARKEERSRERKMRRQKRLEEEAQRSQEGSRRRQTSAEAEPATSEDVVGVGH